MSPEIRAESIYTVNGADRVRSGFPKLSARLGAVFDFVQKTAFAVDVGCDHGYIPAALVLSGKCPRAAACDVVPGPLGKASENIHAMGLEGCVELILSDGLKNPDIYRMTKECGGKGTLIIAGMGGILMRRILTEAPDLEGTFSRLVLQPQSDIALVRKWLGEHGWAIVREEMLTEDGKFYTLFAAEKASGCPEMSEEELEFGPLLLKMADPVLRQYLLRLKAEKQRILASLAEADPERGEKRRVEILTGLKTIERALARYEM